MQDWESLQALSASRSDHMSLIIRSMTSCGMSPEVVTPVWKPQKISRRSEASPPWSVTHVWGEGPGWEGLSVRSVACRRDPSHFTLITATIYGNSWSSESRAEEQLGGECEQYCIEQRVGFGEKISPWHCGGICSDGDIAHDTTPKWRTTERSAPR